MKPEQCLWNYIRNGMKKSGWHPQRHEDGLSAGIPDVSYGIANRNGWIELKAIIKWPKKGNAFIHNLRPAQIAWLFARGRTGGNCWILIKVETDYILAPWFMLPIIIREGLKRESGPFYRLWTKKMDFTEFGEILTEGIYKDQEP